MPSLEQADQKVVFGLDIGTRSVVGTVGYMKDGQFNVIAQAIEKHQTRAMLDGQIHDIGKVGMTIRMVKEKLEQQILRQEYVQSIKKNLVAQLDSVNIVNEDGSVTNLGEQHRQKLNS